jgi:Lon protease-like protein
MTGSAFDPKLEDLPAALPIFPLTGVLLLPRGRFLITLTGIARFIVLDELPLHRGYRRVHADWEVYRRDLEPDEGAIDRDRLLSALKAFFRVHGISADWDTIRQTPDERLVTSLAMICPFAPNEKQALLEAADLQERAEVMIALIEMAALDAPKEGEGSRH